MGIQALRTYQFRNLVDGSVETDARAVVLVGQNGQGKTNFLEAVHYACYGSSFRTRRDDVLHRTGESEMAVEARFSDGEASRTISVRHTTAGKTISIDGKTTRDRKDMIASIPAVVFCHDDIRYVNGPPEMQRWFVNQSLAMIDVAYVDDLRRYGRILKTRNTALRDGQAMILDALDQQLAETGLRLVAQRSQLVGLLGPMLTEMFGAVFSEQHLLELKYRSRWAAYSVADAVTSLSRHREQDLTMKTSTQGPHRDRFPFFLDHQPLSETASTGQQRLVSLLLRVGQARLLSHVLRREPVLLLDDVLLELDPARRQRFVDSLPEYRQAFFTFLPDEQYARFAAGSTITYHVADGTLRA